MNTFTRCIVINLLALSQIDLANLKEFNRAHKPVAVVVVNLYGDTQTFRLNESELELIHPNDIPDKYKMIM